MTIHVRSEIDKLNQLVLALGAQVEQCIVDAVRALENKDINLANAVIKNDDVIDKMEVDLEEECLKGLALYQPVAIDLRLIVAILKINSDLERMGDLAVNIAQSAIIFASQEQIRLPPHISEMAAATKGLVNVCLDALVGLNSSKARQVMKDDDRIDELHRQTYQLVEQRIVENPEQASLLIRVLGVSRNLERIADHATNIAEDVLYMIGGQIVRHHADDHTD